MENSRAERFDAPLTVAIVGAGKRARAYANEALRRPGWLKVTAVADPHPDRCAALADAHGVSPDYRFASHLDLAARPGLVDAIINTTGDAHHFETALPLIRAGYPMLLEKPIALCEAHVRQLIAAAREHGRPVMICHSMRYRTFYQKVRELLLAGSIGQLRSVYASENVSYHHLATTFIRNPRYAGVVPTPMLMQKCCHDMDAIAWLVGAPALRVASFMTPTQFVPENAPAGSTERCLDGCAVENDCPYSARKLYVENHAWDAYPWSDFSDAIVPSDERKLEALKTDSPYGRCVWRCAHTAVDHQNVAIEFSNGVTATFDMFCATARGYRALRLVGTTGGIVGDADAGWIKLRRMSPGPDRMHVEEEIDVTEPTEGHRGGDRRMLEDFVAVVRGEPGARGLTRIEDSLTGHQIVFAADVAQREKRIVEIDAPLYPL